VKKIKEFKTNQIKSDTESGCSIWILVLML